MCGLRQSYCLDSQNTPQVTPFLYLRECFLGLAKQAYNVLHLHGFNKLPFHRKEGHGCQYITHPYRFDPQILVSSGLNCSPYLLKGRNSTWLRILQFSGREHWLAVGLLH